MSGMSLLRALDAQDKQETARILETMPSEVSIRDSEDRIALHYAAETMDLITFQKIYEQDPTLIDCEDKNGYTPLLMSVMGGRTDLVEFLLSKGASLNHVDKDGHSVVHWAVVCGQLETLSFILSKGADVETTDLLKASPLHYATATEEIPSEVALSILHTLIRAGANPNCMDMDERTPILWSASNGNLEAMRSLKQAGGDLQVVDRDRLGVIHCAASHGYHEIIGFYMDSVPRSLIDQRDRSGHTALFYAVTYGHYEAAKRLLSSNANPNHQDNRLRTASHCAAAKGQMRMLKLLKQFNASFEIQNYRGDLPIHEAIQAGSKDLVEWLLALHPSSINAANHEGRTGLHLAAATGNIEMVVLLCSNDCYKNPLMLYKGNLYTPLDLAKRKDHQVVVEYLKMRHNAKLAEEIPEDERKKNRLTFEEQIVQAKLRRGRHLKDDESVTDMESKKRKARRRRASSDFNSEVVHSIEKKNAGVNTTARRISSAGNERILSKLPKSTSTTDLPATPLKSKAEVRIEEIIKEEVEKFQKEKEFPTEEPDFKPSIDQENNGILEFQVPPETEGNVNTKESPDYPNIDEEFEDLPGISDTSDEESVKEKENSIPPQSILKRSQSEGRSKAEIKKNGSRVISGKKSKKSKDSQGGKFVRIYADRKENEKEAGRRVVMRVKREPEIGLDGGDIDIFEDDWAEFDESDQSIRPDVARRYIHEKAIFQELTHLKRMQIQYGKVQERILVRSLVGNFCKMHGLDPSRFKFQTFYSWEKFLYDQLKIIYMAERERLTQARAPRPTLDRFENRLRQARAIPLSDRISNMSHIYATSNQTTGKTTEKKRKEKFICGQGGKRCDCLGKHLLVKQK